MSDSVKKFVRVVIARPILRAAFWATIIELNLGSPMPFEVALRHVTGYFVQILRRSTSESNSRVAGQKLPYRKSTRKELVHVDAHPASLSWFPVFEHVCSNPLSRFNHGICRLRGTSTVRPTAHSNHIQGAVTPFAQHSKVRDRHACILGQHDENCSRTPAVA